ncbi:MAG TPA: neutral zinc metallopeptidase [Pseudorhodoplanes sp.]|nr:neutral zinc metallopeptidase [Pseudorhodoplanes sp.]
MRWEDFRRSDNVEDMRDESGGIGGGGFGLPVGGGGIGIGTIVVLGLIGWALGIDPRLLIGGAEILSGRGGPGMETQYQPRTTPRSGTPSDDAGGFVAAVLGNTEDTWQDIFRESGQRYRAPRLRLFSGAIQGGCGFAQAAMGPFYCPNDQRIYLDTSFFRQIEQRFRGCDGKACQFSQAYVIAHEVGHHVQNLLGILPKAQQAQQASGDRTAANRIQVRVELQADCLAGVWANRSQQRKAFLDPGDIDAALQTASAIGDDNLQRQMQGRVTPDSFTHGSADQRKRWFSIGFQQGKVGACNTFQAANL